jgi:hypothetical protein
MLTRWKAAVLVAVLAAGLFVLPAGVAFADDATGFLNCQSNPRPECEVGAGSSSTSTGAGATPQGGSSCHDPSGAVILCERDGARAGDDGCYYAPTSPSRSTIAALGGQPSGSGGWYQRTCYGPTGTGAESFGEPVWVPGGAAAEPEVVARQAVSKLRLPSVSIVVSPVGDQLVGLPTWLALAAGSWEPQSATATVPGVSVTATATPTEAVWEMGDGGRVVCDGPGTAWRPGMDAGAASPDCGYTYRRSSAGAPDQMFSLSVTVSWSVSWRGAGQQGTVPNLNTGGTVRIAVAESQALVSG